MMRKGIAASAGIAVGKALIVEERKAEVTRQTVERPEGEIGRLKRAIETAKEELVQLKADTEARMGKEKAQIFEAHQMMLEDPELVGQIESQIREESVDAAYALTAAVNMFTQLFQSLDNDYMRERAADIQDVGQRLLNHLLGVETNQLTRLAEPVILVAKDLTPSDTAQLDRSKVLGFVTEIGGSTSHSAIMARSLEIPAVVGLGAVKEAIHTGDTLILDGEQGLVLVNPDEATLVTYQEKQQKLEVEKKALEALISAPSVTRDGKSLVLEGNIGTPENVAGVLKNGGEGIGLFRTEFLYMDKNQLPTEEEQYIAYRKVLEGMGGRPVVIRTLDIGGDKKLPYLPIGEEMNPFLGYRAIRLCLDQTPVFKTQLRALLRASVYGKLKIMFPMVSGIEELRAAKAILEEVKTELAGAGIAFDPQVPVGIMIEIPSAAMISDLLAKEADFFSIGTNDLIQYTVAVDRMNEKISGLYTAYHPAVLRLIKLVVDNGHREGIPVAMCGEMAGDLKALSLLVGLGLDELSMSASSILKVRKRLAQLDSAQAKALAETALNLATPAEIEALLK